MDFATKWEEIGISNDFLFGKIMRRPELCKELLQVVLPQLAIERIEYPEEQKSISVDRDARSVRLDVYVKDEKGTVYNIEMQVLNEGNLPKRSRYYQSMIDLQLLDKGQIYNELNESYIIFICPFDPFGRGRHLYTFRNLCQEDSSIGLNDGTTKIFLNANGTVDDVVGDLKAFLDYVAGKRPENDFVERLDQAVSEAKKNRKWRHEYMTLLMRDQENLARGRAEGRVEGRRESLFAILDHFLKSSPEMTLETAGALLGIGEKDLAEYREREKNMA